MYEYWSFSPDVRIYICIHISILYISTYYMYEYWSLYPGVHIYMYIYLYSIY